MVGMWKVFISTLFFLVIVGSVQASSIQITLERGKVEVGLGELVEFSVEIKNNQEFRDSFSLSVWPPTYISIERDYIVLNPGESKTVKVYVLPSLLAETGTKQYMFVVVSSSNPEVMEKKYFYVKIERRSGVFISSFSIEEGIIQPGEQVVLQTIVKNLDPKPHENIRVEVALKRNDNIVERKVRIFDVIRENEVKTLTTVFNTSKYTPSGEYRAFCVLKDERDRILDVKSESLTVVGIKKLKRDKHVDYGLFLHKVSITVTNEGNERVEKVIVMESVPKFMKDMFYPDVGPTSVEESESRVIYKWIVPVLEPGESITIGYELRFINVFVLTVITVGLILIGTLYKITPKVEKRIAHRTVKKETFISVTLHVKNRFVTTIKDVVVEDLVPPIFVVLDYFESLRPKMKTAGKGLKLVWNVGSLRPGEERILTYRIKPRVGVVGKLKLPKAVMRYKGIVKKKGEVVSKSVEIVSIEREKIL